jgi:Zn-dependent metalloprotease
MIMKNRFINIHFHAADKEEGQSDSIIDRPRMIQRGPGGVRGRKLDAEFNTDEAAARFYLSNILDRDPRPAMRGLTASDKPEMVPDMRMKKIQDSPLTKTRLVHFEQTQSSIPVFGSQVVVELNPKRELISIEGDLAEMEQVSPIPSVSQEQALKSIARLVGMELSELKVSEPGTLTYYHDEEKDAWHLAYYFKKVPAAPQGFLVAARSSKSRGHGGTSSPRRKFLLLDYLIDAHDGEVLLYYSAAPMLTRCKGIDESGTNHVFFGLLVDDTFEMNDTLRKIKTYDMKLADYEGDFPQIAVRNPRADYSDENRAAVSAHINAMRVMDFFRLVLARDGVDGKGMELISVVNCTSSDETPPEWHNAVWWNNRMWYGQARDENDVLRSHSRYLDIIAHELTHGVTEHTCDLMYWRQSGALNESFSDIFGVIINNWFTIGGENWNTDGANTDVSEWDWEIGKGWGEEGLPLRDLSDPTKTGDPDSMDGYLNILEDNGGVHSNSNIHNKAAYNLLTAVDEQGNRVFSSRDVAILYYSCLQRLNKTATFSKTLQTLIDVANTFYAGDPEEQKAKVGHIRKAYEKVGIKGPFE